MQTSPVYWFINWEFLTQHPSATATKEANNLGNSVWIFTLDLARNDRRKEPILLTFYYAYVNRVTGLGFLVVFVKFLRVIRVVLVVWGF